MISRLGPTLRRLRRELAPFTGLMAFSSGMRVLHQGGNILLLGIAANGLAGLWRGDRSGIAATIWTMVAIGLVKGVCRYLEQYSGHYIAFLILAKFRANLFRGLAPQAPAVLSHRQSGGLLSQATADIDRIEVFYAHTIAPLVTAVVLTAATVAAVAWLGHPQLAGVLLVALLIVGFVAPAAAVVAGQPWAEQGRTRAAAAAAHLTDSIVGLREVLALGFAGERHREMGEIAAQQVVTEAGAVRVSAVQALVTDLAVGAGVGGVALVGAGLVAAGQLTLETLMVVIAVTVGAFGPALGLANAARDLGPALAAAERLFGVIDARPAVSSPARPQDLPAKHAQIELQGVSFKHREWVEDGAEGPPASRGGEWALRDVSLKVAPGQQVAIVGPSGSGKSTLAGLLVRIWDPDEGRVLVGGVDGRALELDGLRRTVGLVSPGTHVFAASLADNLLLGDEQADEGRLREACGVADLAEWVDSLPAGLESQAGDMGDQMSGGQRQRLAIGREALRRAPVLILDEATAHLDPASERRVLRNLRLARPGGTLIVISHRIASVAHADVIWVMDGGRIVESGDHRELLAQGGMYARLYRLQRDELDLPAGPDDRPADR